MTDKLELKSCHEVIDTVDVANIETIFHGKPIDPDILIVVMRDGKRLYCDEVCPVDSLQKEPVSNPIDFEQELYKAFGQVKDFTLGMRIAKWFYDMGKNHQEPISEDLEEASFDYAEACKYEGGEKLLCVEHFKAGAQWQREQDQSTIELAEDHAMLAGMEKMKEQMMAKAIDAQCFGFQGAALFSFRLPADSYLVGSEVKIIVVKED